MFLNNCMLCNTQMIKCPIAFDKNPKTNAILDDYICPNLVNENRSHFIYDENSIKISENSEILIDNFYIINYNGSCYYEYNLLTNNYNYLSRFDFDSKIWDQFDILNFDKEKFLEKLRMYNIFK